MFERGNYVKVIDAGKTYYGRVHSTVREVTKDKDNNEVLGNVIFVVVYYHDDKLESAKLTVDPKKVTKL